MTQINQIKEWVKANKLLSAIIVGVIIVVIILYLGMRGQAPAAEEQTTKEAGVEVPTEEAAEVPTQEVAAPETAPEEAPPAETVEEPAETTESGTA